ncbi:MAG: chemotaxis protein CheD [Candidatus Muiribacteriota bacterium]
MSNLIVGISDMKISSKTEDVLITYSLGSCLGLTVYDTNLKIGGLIHCLLPAVKIDTAKAEKNPSMFVESGVSLLFTKLFNKGARKKNMLVKAAGCGAPLVKSSQFNIGDRNFTILRKILWKNNILLTGKDIGGAKARTLMLNIATGETFVKSGNQKYQI